jgi:phage terminase large subunit GpA-like protein
MNLAQVPAYSHKLTQYILRQNLNKVILAGRAAVMPPADIKISEFAERERYLPEDSYVPGLWRHENLPHGVEIMDAAIDPEVRQITMMGSSQWGKTELLNTILGYFIKYRPCKMMVLQPTDTDARDYVKEKLEGMLDGTRSLRELVSKRNNWDNGSSTLIKVFPGGRLKITSAKSTSATRQRTYKIVVIDDLDAIEVGSTKEGDIVVRARKRTTTHKDSLVITISTPTIWGSSRIQMQYDLSSRGKYNVTCPNCGDEFFFKTENLVWKKDLDMFLNPVKHYPETAVYPCEKCGCEINEKTRRYMLQNGLWVHERPEIKDHRGYWLPEISSTLSSFKQVAKQIIEAGDNEEALEAVTNTVYGLPYKKIQGEEIDPMKLMERYLKVDYMTEDDRRIPNEVLYIVAAADVQANRLEVMIEGYGLKEQSWLLFYGKIPGDPKQPQVWDALDKLYTMQLERKDGIKLKIRRKFVDSGYLAETVYRYTHKREYTEGIWSIKGSGTPFKHMVPKKFFVHGRERMKWMQLGSDMAKEELFARLSISDPTMPRYKHYTKVYCDTEFFKQFAHEVAVRKFTGGIPYIHYEKPDDKLRNEVIDLSYYCLAAFKYSRVNLEREAKRIERMKAELTNTAPDMSGPLASEDTPPHGERGQEVGEQSAVADTKIIPEVSAAEKPAEESKPTPQVKKKKIRIKNNFVKGW